MTECKQCGADKPESEFYASNLSRCKDCVKDRVRKNRAANIEH